MKTLLFCLIMLLCGQTMLAQSPFQLNYQGTARDQSGVAMANQVLRIRVTIRSGSAIGPAEYSETRGVTTNKYGLFNFAIGSAGALYANGTLQGVNWGAGNKYMQVEMDAAGNNNFVDLGASQLLSVPYALYALQSGSAAPALLADNGVAITDSIVQLGNPVGDSSARFSTSREVPLGGNNLFFSNGRLSINNNTKSDAFLTIESTDQRVPTLVLTSSTPKHYQSILVHKASEAAQSGTGLDWSFNMQDYVNIQPDGVAHTNNTVYQYGWNISPWGDRADPTKAAFLQSWEQRFAIGDYGDCSEFHVVGINKQGVSRRHWSVLSSHDARNSYMYWTANSYTWYADTPVPDVAMMSLAKSGTLGLNGEDSKIDFTKSLANGGTAIIRQLNAAGDRYYSLFGLNDMDELQVGSIETPVWMQHGFLNLGGYNKPYGAIFNLQDKEIHIGVPEPATNRAPHNTLQVNSWGRDMVKLKAWHSGVTWAHGIDDYGHFYIKDVDNSQQKMMLRNQGGILFPTYTSAERDNITDPQDGELIYNRDVINPEGKVGDFEFYRADDASWTTFSTTSRNIANADLTVTGHRVVAGNNRNLSFNAFNRLQYNSNEYQVNTTNGIALMDQGGRVRIPNLPDVHANNPNGYLAIDDSGYVFRAHGGVFRQVVNTTSKIYAVSQDDYTIQLSDLTQTSQVTLPDPATCKGRILVLWNGNQSVVAVWKTDRPIFETPKKSFTVIPNESSLQIQSDGVRWIKIN
ncbi:MAG TPA: hypothetical protein VD993_06795 [Chitinophagaceae bacterium]|nr:hypothetical protein [Chitinophagaceae bacterium]